MPAEPNADPPPLRVLIAHDFAARYGGGEHMALGLRDALRDRGHDVRFFASRAELIDGVPREADSTCFGTTSPLRRVSQALNPSAARAIARELDEFRPHVVHVRMFLSQLSPLIFPAIRRARRRHGTRAILHVVTPDLFCPLSTKILPNGTPCHHPVGRACHAEGCLSWAGMARAAVQHGLTRRWLPVFDRVVANSAYMQSRIRDEGLRCERFVWNGIPDVPRRPPLTGPPTVAFAGRLTASKGADVLIRAMPLVRKRVPDARLIVAGDGPDRAKLEVLAATEGVGDAVDFAGHLPHAKLSPLLETAWVQAVPSLWQEPFGIVCAEAMLRGTAVVATASGGLVEQVTEGETGRLCPAGDVRAWADALADLLSDRDLCERHGTAGHARADADFRQSRFVDEFESIYREILAEGA